MKIKPVEVAAVPQYPDKYQEEVKHALKSAKPNRWKGTSLAALGLSAVVALGLGGCKPGYTTEGTPMQSPIVPTLVSGELEEYLTFGEPVLLPTIPEDLMIPLFEFGEGTGAFGGVSFSTPVLLSEEEAYAVISSAFAEAGLILNRTGDTLKNANLPVTDVYESYDAKNRYDTVKADIVPDGLLWNDLPIIFVSANDVGSWHKDDGHFSTVTSYDVKKTAQTLAENNPYLVVFYDPVAAETVFDQPQAEARAESERLLQLQVEAFITWLRDGGYY